MGERVKSFAKNKDGSPDKRYEQLSRLYSKQEKAFDNFLNGDNIDFNSKKYSHCLGLIREFCNSAKYYERDSKCYNAVVHFNTSSHVGFQVGLDRCGQSLGVINTDVISIKNDKNVVNISLYDIITRAYRFWRRLFKYIK